MVDAAGIIGSGSPGDDGLLPVEHAEQLRTSAPKLAALLTRSAPVELARYAEVSIAVLHTALVLEVPAPYRRQKTLPTHRAPAVSLRARSPRPSAKHPSPLFRRIDDRRMRPEPVEGPFALRQHVSPGEGLD
jgi:hypothetical protein